MNTNSKILVTGGAGFIGSHLCQKLLAAGCKVTVIDDLSTGSLNNIARFKDNKKFEFIKGTVRSEKIMNELIQRCDTVYHLAAAVGVNLIVEKPVHTIKTNIHGTEVVLEAANEFRKKV
ncbi:MAG: SDR family NAD(P)-dependent oxidoreductase, partial [Planctomycetes bacterium]|nr:SDR family NAD(P)-dependent oxidoreductase [Planctomycetota bacterium]